MTADIKAMVLEALDDVGGPRYLARQAIENPGPFMALLGKILPTQVTSADGSLVHLHLLAAQAVSVESIAVLEQREQPPTINGYDLPTQSTPTE